MRRPGTVSVILAVFAATLALLAFLLGRDGLGAVLVPATLGLLVALRLMRKG